MGTYTYKNGFLLQQRVRPARQHCHYKLHASITRSVWARKQESNYAAAQQWASMISLPVIDWKVGQNLTYIASVVYNRFYLGQETSYIRPYPLLYKYTTVHIHYCHIYYYCTYGHIHCTGTNIHYYCTYTR